MCLQELLTRLRMQSQALKQSHHQADTIRTREFEVGRGRELGVDLDDFLKKNRYGTHRVPEQNR